MRPARRRPTMATAIFALPLLFVACGGGSGDNADTSARGSDDTVATTTAPPRTVDTPDATAGDAAESGDAISDAEMSELEEQLDDIEQILDELDTELSQD